MKRLTFLLAALALGIGPAAGRDAPWSREKAWTWYNAQPWIRGCNYIPSDAVNYVDMWQEYGFGRHLATADRELALAEETGFNTVRLFLVYEVWLYEREGFLKRFDRFLDVCDRHGIRAIVVLFSDCAPPKEAFYLKRMGDQRKVYRGLGIKARSPHTGSDTVGYNILDIPEHVEKLLEMEEELLTLHRHDRRILFWNVWNEPGNSNRGEASVEPMKELFQLAWKIDPKQPLAADVWSGTPETGYGMASLEKSKNKAQVWAGRLSDIVSYHCYRDFETQVKVIRRLKQFYGRPMVNTEWLARVSHNDVFSAYPLYYIEKVGCTCWGFVAGKYQTYEPWEAMWRDYEKGTEKSRTWDFTKWLHDLYRPSLRPYDPKEIETIKTFNKLADEDFRR